MCDHTVVFPELQLSIPVPNWDRSEKVGVCQSAQTIGMQPKQTYFLQQFWTVLSFSLFFWVDNSEVSQPHLTAPVYKQVWPTEAQCHPVSSSIAFFPLFQGAFTAIFIGIMWYQTGVTPEVLSECQVHRPDKV